MISFFHFSIIKIKTAANNWKWRLNSYVEAKIQVEGSSSGLVWLTSPQSWLVSIPSIAHSLDLPPPSPILATYQKPWVDREIKSKILNENEEWRNTLSFLFSPPQLLGSLQIRSVRCRHSCNPAPSSQQAFNFSESVSCLENGSDNRFIPTSFISSENQVTYVRILSHLYSFQTTVELQFWRRGFREEPPAVKSGYLLAPCTPHAGNPCVLAFYALPLH